MENYSSNIIRNTQERFPSLPVLFGGIFFVTAFMFFTAAGSVFAEETVESTVIPQTADVTATPETSLAETQTPQTAPVFETTVTERVGDFSSRYSPLDRTDMSNTFGCVLIQGLFGIPVCGPSGRHDPAPNKCEPAELSVSDNSFRYSGPALTGYKIRYCDGSFAEASYHGEDGRVEIVDLGKRIARISVQAGTCEKAAIQSCDAPLPDPVCRMKAEPSEVRAGDATRIVWESQHAVRASFSALVTATDASGSFEVHPQDTTTIVGTFTGENGATVSCDTTVTVRHESTPPSDKFWCKMGVNPSSIVRGNSATLWWESNLARYVNITGVGTHLPPSGSQSVSPTVTTTYRGDFCTESGTYCPCSATLTVTEPTSDPAPTCSVSVSQSSVTPGSEVTLSWSSAHTVNASFDQGIGSVPTGGSRNVRVDRATTYTGSFTSEHGTRVTCTASVSLKSGGGGGKCVNCDSTKKTTTKTTKTEKPSPTILLGKTVTKTGDYITLDQVPYTGFEASPLVTALFWFAVFALSAGIAYALTVYQPLSRLGLMLAARAQATEERAHALYRASIGAQVPTHYSAMEALSVSPEAKNGVGFIEEMAHDENILLSPEASRILMQGVDGSGAMPQAYVRSLFDQAKATYAREDGWILLSKERIQNLVSRGQGAQVNGGQNDRTQTPQTPFAAMRKAPAFEHSSRGAETGRPTVSAEYAPVSLEKAPDPIAFIESLSSGAQQKTYELMRRLAAQGTTESFIGQVIRMLDDVYKNRLEGNHNPNRELAAKTATWSNGDFEKVLGILVECIDYSYTSSRIGTKVALAKVFEYFEKKSA